ncbi:multiheme c-type cytochrome [Candidatus Leptofilum sp.]|uniref:multiheme c-type cytochrome n=1 Tax=Candidatus Leptofilum sp. TaxID=3241576 RepID=UPI003B590E03
MKQFLKSLKVSWSVLLGGLVGTAVLLFTMQIALAQDDEPDAPIIPTQECQECHLDVASHWEESAHANAYANEVFQEKWVGLGEPAECLACHTTNFQPATGEFDEEGVACESCHGETTTEHPPEPVPILADTEYCGSCHTTSLGEWHQTGHASEEIGCMDCHDPHSQQPLFEESDALCLNCHEDSAENYLEDLHIQEGIGCMDCHGLVIPPEEMPDDGVVPTGHSFTINSETCVACHTDTVHAGTALPDYSHDAVAEGELIDVLTASAGEAEADELTPEQKLQTLEAALANRNLALLFQGGVLGLVLGGSTAWFVANNVRQRREHEERDEQ